MEQIDKDTTYVLKKAEGKRKGLRGCKEKIKKRSSVLHLTLVMKKKEGKNESNAQASERKQIARTLTNTENSLR